MTHIIRYIYNIIVLFGFIFEIPIVSFLTTRRISCIIAIIYLLVNYKKLRTIYALMDKKSIVNIVFLLSVPFLLTVIYSLGIVRDTTSIYLEPWFFLNLLIYVLLFAIYCVIEFEDVKSFLFVYLSCFVIQVIFVFWAVIDSNMRLLLYNLFYFGDDRFEDAIENGKRIMGIKLYGAEGSVICSTSIVLLTYCYLKNYIKVIVYFVFFIVLFGMTLFIGRTGVFIELLCVFYAILFGKRVNRLMVFILVVISVILIGFFLSEILSHAENGEYLFRWMLNAFTNEGRDATLNGINRTLPPFSTEFIFGTMVMFGKTSSGIIVDSDSGYIRMYSSLGIIGSIFFYLGILSLYRIVKINKNEKLIKCFFLLLIIISFIIEYKEPFILKYVFSYIILVVTLFSAKEIINNN